MDVPIYLVPCNRRVSSEKGLSTELMSIDEMHKGLGKNSLSCFDLICKVITTLSGTNGV